MRNAVIFLLGIAVCALGFLAYSQSALLRDHQRQIQELSAKVEARAKAASLDLQERCAKQASEVFKSEGWGKEWMAGFENHYNEKLNRCFMMVENTDVRTTSGRISNSKLLTDAFERKTLANYFWMSDKAKQYWEVRPFQCDVMLPSGEKKVCQSSDEFEELIKVYMQ